MHFICQKLCDSDSTVITIKAGHFGATVSALTVLMLRLFGTGRYGAERYSASAVCGGGGNVTQRKMYCIR